jgi:hypothetical protein
LEVKWFIKKPARQSQLGTIGATLGVYVHTIRAQDASRSPQYAMA